MDEDCDLGWAYEVVWAYLVVVEYYWEFLGPATLERTQESTDQHILISIATIFGRLPASRHPPLDIKTASKIQTSLQNITNPLKKHTLSPHPNANKQKLSPKTNLIIKFTIKISIKYSKYILIVSET